MNPNSYKVMSDFIEALVSQKACCIAASYSMFTKLIHYLLFKTILLCKHFGIYNMIDSRSIANYNQVNFMVVKEELHN